MELDKYLGFGMRWPKANVFERKCAFNVTATYTLNENGNIVVDNKCADQDGDLQQSLGEAFVVNAPFNSKLKSSFT